jgi:hypothetical protein
MSAHTPPSVRSVSPRVTLKIHDIHQEGPKLSIVLALKTNPLCSDLYSDLLPLFILQLLLCHFYLVW